MTPCGWDGAPDKALNEWHLTSVRDVIEVGYLKREGFQVPGTFSPAFHYGVNSNVFQPIPSITCGEIGTV